MCELLAEARCHVQRVEEHASRGAFGMAGHELNALARNAIALDTFVREVETEGANEVPDAFDYERLTPEELDTLEAILQRVPVRKVTSAAPLASACGHVRLLETVRAQIQEQTTSTGFALKPYELADLSAKALALDELLKRYEGAAEAEESDLGALPLEDFARYVELTERARRA